jgi:hypothetical protein
VTFAPSFIVSVLASSLYYVSMNGSDIIGLRLHNHHLGTALGSPEVVVQSFGAMQAQDYAGAKWAVAQRTTGATSTEIDQAFAEAKMLRTHLMRPTWHFVAAADIRWLLALTAPRIKRLAAYYERKLGLDEVLLAQTNQLITDALQGGQQLTRHELGTVLEQQGIELGSGDAMRLTYIMGRAELDAIICSGALRGKQQTYALLDERVPAGNILSREEALAELAQRYFASHGPATLKDYAWWSGLTMSNAKAGLQAVQSSLTAAVVHDQTYWYDASRTPATLNVSSVHLLPNYDEYVVAYADRSLIFDRQHIAKLDARANPLFSHVIVADGRIAGTWKLASRKKAVTIETKLFAPLSDSQQEVLPGILEHYSNFLNIPVSLSTTSNSSAAT